MLVNKITINYGEPLELEGEEGSLTLIKEGQKVLIIPEELGEIIRVATLLGWEEFR